MSDRKRPTNIGGQAVIEGVMMRGKKIYAMAVRNPEGEIVVEKKPVGGLGKKGLFRYPIFRGMAAFVDSLVTGTKILMRSAEIAGEGWQGGYKLIRNLLRRSKTTELFYYWWT